MKTFISLILVAISFVSKVDAQEKVHAQAKGCDGPLQESKIDAKVYTSDGDEKTNESCLRFIRISPLTINNVFNSNLGSDNLNWVFFIDEGEKLIVDSKFISENKNCEDTAGFITIHSGEFSNFEMSSYTQVHEGETYTGYRYIADITDAMEFEIASPSVYDTVRITVKILEPEGPSSSYVAEQAFLSQINSSNSVIISTNSNEIETVEIYSSTGDLVRELSVSDQQIIELEDLVPGMYFFRADVNGEQMTGKYLQF